MSNSQVLISFECKPTAIQISSWWTDLDFKEQQTVATWSDAVAWANARDGYLNGQEGNSVKIIFKNGKRWVLTDFSMLMYDCENELSNVSVQVGDIFLAMTQGTAGCAGFKAYSKGVLVRSIDYADGELTEEGTPLSQENKINLSELYDRELNKLWIKLGHEGLLFDMNPTELECLLFVDNGELSYIKSDNVPRNQKNVSKKSWWKFW